MLRASKFSAPKHSTHFQYEWSINMNRLFLPLFLLVLPIANATAGGDKPPEGFAALFNGKDLAGWEIMNGGKFVAEGGVIKLPRGGGWLRSEQEYDDFILRLEVRWLKDKQDSGIFLRAGKEGKNWPDRKYEVQCENSERVVHIFGAKCIRDSKKAVGLLKPTGEWNSIEVHCAGTLCKVKLNVEPISSADDLKNPKGYLGLQGEEGELEFRNLFLKRLEPETKK
jgi:hypothetical protein